MNTWLLTPPVVFAIVFLFMLLFSFGLSALSYKRKGEREDGTGKAYACGEDVEDHMAQPDYSQFFPFAFFFTVAHVATMMITAIPLESVNTLIMAELYIVAVVAGLFILFRR
jgi:NADH-quinone oxidoreductase subunit A